MRAPDIDAPPVRVWRLAMKPVGQRMEAAHDGALCAYLIEGPFHPGWNQWVLNVVHLRFIEGAPLPRLRFPNASHEFVIYAVNPENGPVPVDEWEAGTWDRQHPLWMVPMDLTHQVADATDEQATAIGERMVELIVGGTASPDQDWAPWWEKAIDGALDHLRTGGTHMPPLPPGRA